MSQEKQKSSKILISLRVFNGHIAVTFKTREKYSMVSSNIPELKATSPYAENKQKKHISDATHFNALHN